MCWSANGSGLRPQWGIPPHFSTALPECPTWGKAGLPVLWVSPLEQKLLGWLGMKGHTGVCFPCLSAAVSFQLSQTSKELFKASGAGGTKWSKEKKGILVCLPCSDSSENLRGREYSPVENSFQCVCEIGRMAARWEALFHGLPHLSVTVSATWSRALSSSPP